MAGSVLPVSAGRCVVNVDTCPSCGQMTVVEITFGMPAPDMFEAEERGEVILGGCLLPGPDEPRRPCGCTACGWRGGFDQWDVAVEAPLAVLDARIEDAVWAVERGETSAGLDFLSDVIEEATAIEGVDGLIASRAVWTRAETIYLHGDPADAIVAIRAAMEVETRSDHVDSEGMIDLRGRLAFSLSDVGDHDESLATWEALLPVVDASFGREHAEALGWRMGYGECLAAAGRPADGLEVLREVVELAKEHCPRADLAKAARQHIRRITASS